MLTQNMGQTPKKVLSNLTNLPSSHRIAGCVSPKNIRCNSEGKENAPDNLYYKCSDVNNRDLRVLSPELFSEDEGNLLECNRECSKRRVVSTFPRNLVQEKYSHADDEWLLRSVRNGLSGVFPPPSVTMVRLSLPEMLAQIEINKHLFEWTVSCARTSNNTFSHLVSGSLSDAKSQPWPQILNSRHHGIHYNRCRLSEDFELMCTKYAQRFVGAETQSTCTIFDTCANSPNKKKVIKPKWAVKSPGRRLSHLARRRITFSSNSLQCAATSNITNRRMKQILIPTRKYKSPRHTPKKTPNKNLSRKSSSSSKKKSVSKSLVNLFVPGGSGSRRALFSSPARSLNQSFCTSEICSIYQKKSTKRALFPSPLKRPPGLISSGNSVSPSLSGNSDADRKRRRCDSWSTDLKLPGHVHASKAIVDPTLETVLSVRTGTTSLTTSSSSTSLNMHTTLTSAGFPHVQLTELHKKKLQWAVYEALRNLNVTKSHPNFKEFAAILARVTRRFLPSVAPNVIRTEETTTERMMRIARQHSYAVVAGKSVDEILKDYLQNRMARQPTKAQGYVGKSDPPSIGGAHAIVGTDSTKDSSESFGSSFTYKSMSGSESISRAPLDTIVGGNSRLERIRKVINFHGFNG